MTANTDKEVIIVSMSVADMLHCLQGRKERPYKISFKNLHYEDDAKHIGAFAV